MASSFISTACGNNNNNDFSISDYSGPILKRSTWLGIWHPKYCVIKGTTLRFYNNSSDISSTSDYEALDIEPGKNLMYFIDEPAVVSLWSLSKYQQPRYIINIKDHSHRILFSLQALTEDSWNNWIFHIRLSIDLSCRLHSFRVNQFSTASIYDFIQANVSELMHYSSAIFDLVKDRESYRNIEECADIDGSLYNPGCNERKLLIAFELQCSIICEELCKLFSEDNLSFNMDIQTESFIILYSLLSTYITSYCGDQCYQHIRELMLSSLKLLNSLQTFIESNSNTFITPYKDTIFDLVSTFSHVFLLNLSTISAYSYTTPPTTTTLNPINNTHSHTLEAKISLFTRDNNNNNEFLNNYKINVNKLICIPSDPISILISSYFESNTDCNTCSYYLQNKYQTITDAVKSFNTQGITITWNSLLTASRYSDCTLMKYLLDSYTSTKMSFKIINWRELFVECCLQCASLPLIEVIIRHCSEVGHVIPAEVLALLVYSDHATVETLDHIFRTIFDANIQHLDMSTCSTNLISCETYLNSPAHKILRSKHFLDGQTLLHVAALTDNVDIISYVHSLDPTQALVHDSRDFTPLHVACANSSSLAVVQTLYAYNPEAFYTLTSSSSTVSWPDVRQRACLPIHLAALKCRSLAVFKFCLQTLLHDDHHHPCEPTHANRINDLLICFQNIVINGNQHFDTNRIACLKCLLSQTTVRVPLKLLSVTSNPMSLSYHYAYLPPYDYVAKPTRNDQLARMLYRYDYTCPTLDYCDDNIYRELNWRARKMAFLISHHGYTGDSGDRDEPCEQLLPVLPQDDNSPSQRFWSSSLCSGFSMPGMMVSQSHEGVARTCTALVHKENNIPRPKRFNIWRELRLRHGTHDILKICVSYL